MRGHKVALTGSYGGGNTEKLFDSLQECGIQQLTLVGREITIQVKSEDLDDVKKRLSKLGVGNISMLEWKKFGTTFSGSGSGSDEKEMVKVSLIPTAIDEGLRLIAVVNTFPVKEELVNLMKHTVEEVLDNAGVTDAIFTIHVNKETSNENYAEAVKVATLNALFESGGVVSIE